MAPGPHAIVIADDLTGAADTGIQFTALGSPVYLLPAETMPLARPRQAAAGLSLYTASRALTAFAAADCLRSAAQALPHPPPRWIYKKIDSCLRGNLGAEIDALLAELGPDTALIAPALPAQGRTTIDGIHRIRGIPLARTRFADDLTTASSSIAEILAHQSRHPIGQVRLQTYGDPKRLQRAIQRERERGCRLIACDAAEQAHLDQLAALIIRDPDRLLPVGSAGLAASLVRQLAPGKPVAPAPIPGGLERLLIVCGTGAPITRRQLDALLRKHPGASHAPEFEWLIAASARDRRRQAATLLTAWSGGVLALVLRHPPPATRISPERAAAGLASLAELATEIVRTGPVDGLFLSGGDTAAAFLRASGGEAIELQREILPGLVLGRRIGGMADGLPVVTKAGAFGDEQTLVTLYEGLSVGNIDWGKPFFS